MGVASTWQVPYWYHFMKTIQVYLVFNSFKMLGESNFLWEKAGCILKHPLGSWHLICSPCPDDDKLFIARARACCDPNPPTYCSNRVARQTKSCFILFINREEGGVAGAGARMGRVVASKCDPYYVWHTQISTIQECMQTANLRQNVNSWYLVTNANKFWNQSWEMWNKKSNP